MSTLQATNMGSRRLGFDGPEISVIGHGAWEAGGMWGTNPPDEQIVAAMHAAFEAGVTWIDTAEVYGPHRSEELVGRAIEGRDDVMVFTKVAPRVEINGRVFGSGLDPDGVRAAAEGTLKRLGREVIDLYQVHIPWPQVPVEETWGAMAQLVDDGLVRYIGVSNFEAHLLERCEAIRHVDACQVHFSLLHPAARDELIPVCQRNGTGVLCYGALGFGLLTGTITRDTEFSPDDWRSGAIPIPVPLYQQIFAPVARERHLAVVEQLPVVAQRLGLAPAQLALAWVIHQPGVTGVICGTRSPDRARENAAAAGVELTGEDVFEIDALLA